MYLFQTVLGLSDRFVPSFVGAEALVALAIALKLRH